MAFSTLLWGTPKWAKCPQVEERVARPMPSGALALSGASFIVSGRFVRKPPMTVSGAGRRVARDAHARIGCGTRASAWQSQMSWASPPRVDGRAARAAKDLDALAQQRPSR